MNNQVRTVIAGIGSYVPDTILTNDQLAGMVDTNDEWITQRTGIKQRRVIGQAEYGSAGLAARAARAACQAAKLDPSQLDMIICATITPETLCPATACYVQADLGAAKAVAFDISAACSGFIYAMAVGEKFIQSGSHKNVLVIGAETLTRFTDYTDRSSCILFGDGAGAAVLQPAPSGSDRGICYTTLHTDGTGGDLIYIPAGGSRLPASAQTVAGGQHFLKLRGREVYKFAVEKMQWLLEDCMRACNLSPQDVALVVPHQVNSRVIESAADKLKFPLEKVLVNIDRYGNTSSASIPIALDEAWRAGRIKPGDTVILIAFGAGLTWAGAVVKF
jgi:3-oxoacyl-[acyl-carrier-protein] synthase-3